MYIENTWIKKTHCVAKSHAWDFVSKIMWPPGPGQWSAPCIWHWWGPSWILYLVLGPSLQEGHWSNGGISEKGIKAGEGCEAQVLCGVAEEAGSVLSGEKVSENGIALYSHLKEVCRQKRVSLCSQSVTRQEKIAPCCARRSFDWILGKNSPWKALLSTETGCPEKWLNDLEILNIEMSCRRHLGTCLSVGSVRFTIWLDLKGLLKAKGFHYSFIFKHKAKNYILK